MNQNHHKDTNKVYNLKAVHKSLEGIIRRLNKLASDQDDFLVKKMCENLADDLNKEEYRITVVGQFSSGKSTFINALIGRDILPHGVSETTATITYIHNVQENDERLGTALVVFRDDKTETVSIKEKSNALVDYLTTTSAKCNVATDISHVDLYVHFDGVDAKLVIIDTPGLEGVAEGLRDITLEEVQHSDASICLFHSRGLSEPDIPFFEYLHKFQSQLFFIMNGIDNLKESEGLTYECALDIFKKQIKGKIYNGKIEPKYVFAVSSMYALATKDHNIKRVTNSDTQDLDEDMRKDYWEKSHFEPLQSELFAYLSQSKLKVMFYVQIAGSLQRIISDAINGRKQVLDLYKAKKEELPEEKELKALLKQIDQNSSANTYNLQTSMKAQIGDIEQEIKNYCKCDLNKKVESIKKEIEAIGSFDEYEKFTKQTLPKTVSGYWSLLCNQTEAKISHRLDDVLNDLLGQIPRLFPQFSYTNINGRNQWNVKLKEKVDTNVVNNTRSERIKQDIENLNHQLTVKDGQLQDVRAKESNISQKEASIQEVQQSYRSELRSIGKRPEFRHWTTRHKVKHHILFIIPYYETETIDHDNQSELNAWDREKRKIKDKYDKELKRLNDQKSMLESQLNGSSSNLVKAQIGIIENRKASKEKELKDALEEEERNKRIARNETLRRYKKALSTEVDRQLNSEWPVTINQDIRRNLDGNKEKMWSIVDAQYAQAKDSCKNKITIALKKLSSSNDNEDQRTVTNLSSHIAQLNDISKQISNVEHELSKS